MKFKFFQRKARNQMEYKILHSCPRSHWIRDYDAATLLKDVFPCEGCPDNGACGTFRAGGKNYSEKYLSEPIGSFIRREKIPMEDKKKFREFGTLPKRYEFNRYLKTIESVDISSSGHDTFSFLLNGIGDGETYIVSRSELEELRDAINKALAEHSDA